MTTEPKYTPDMWPENLTMDGITVSRRQLDEAWRRWVGGGVLSFAALNKLLVAICEQGAEHSDKPYYRIVCVVLQTAREAGLIERADPGVDPAWCLAPGYFG